MNNKLFYTVCWIFLMLFASLSGFAKIDSTLYPVVIKGDTIFSIASDNSHFSPTERAHIIENRINTLSASNDFNPDSLVVEQQNLHFKIRHKGALLMTVTQHEASIFGLTALELANQRQLIIRDLLESKFSLKKVWSWVKEIGLTVLVILFFYLFIKFGNKLFNWISTKVDASKEKWINGIKFRNYEFLSPERELAFIQRVLNAIKWLFVILLVYITLPILFSIFPGTQGIADTLIGYIWSPFKSILTSLWNFFPNLISIAVILFITSYVVKFLKFLSEEIESEKLQLPGFYPDWAKPTFNIVKALIYAFALVIIFPYLPGSNSPVFQGVSVFLGLLISLGSSSAISNLIAGMVITYMRAFKIGDRVMIGSTTGDVIEKTALVTRIRTIKNETITIPNASILAGATVNYTSAVQNINLILHTSVTIGYDVPWRKVHELLTKAAEKTENILENPPPFVLQTSLNDFYVSYELNAYTDKPKLSSKIYSDIHQNIQDLFQESKIEILSPHYRVLREDGTTETKVTE